MTAKTAQWARVLDAAEYELRHRNVIEARRHLASMTPERRAMLEAEWDTQAEQGARVEGIRGGNAARQWAGGYR